MIGSRNYSKKSTGLRPIWFIGFFLVLCVFHLQTFSLTDDHFDRISRAHQIAQYGELPYRDFFDPGYFLTLFSSAAAQSVFGGVLLGEAVIAVLGLSLGFSLTLLLLVQVTRSWPLAFLITGAAVFAAPRFYDYDKVFFYSLGIFLCWRYIERTSLKNLALLGLGTATAFWFRYDNGLYIACATTVALFVIHGKHRVLLHHFVIYSLTIVALSLPCLIFLQLSGSLWQYGSEIVDYASREGVRTSLFQFPDIQIDDEAPLLAVASRPSYPIRVRWALDVNDAQRILLEQHYALQSPRLVGGPTWAYRLQDTSSQHIRQLIEDPRIEDTGLIDRGMATVPAAESIAGHVRRSLMSLVPVFRLRVLPGVFSATNAEAFSYYLCLSIPILTFLFVLLPIGRCRGRRSWRREMARGLSLATLCLLVDAFVLRDPIAARVGAVAPTITVLGTWNLMQWVPLRTKLPIQSENRETPNMPLKIAYALFVACLAVGVVLLADEKLTPTLLSPQSWRSTVAKLAASPPSEDLLPRGGQAGLIRYLRACIGPQDRLLATWFVPQLFALAGRGFAGGMPVFFGGHWSEIPYQRRIIARLEKQSVPLVLMKEKTVDDFRRNFILVDEHVRRNYRLVEKSSFGDSEVRDDGYWVLKRRGLPITRRYEPGGLPCFR